MSTRPGSAPPLAAGQPQPNRLKLVLAAGLQEIGAPQDKANPSKKAPSWGFGKSKATQDAERTIKELESRAKECEGKESAMRARALDATKKFNDAQERMEAMEQDRLRLRSELEEAKAKASSASRAAIQKLQESNLSKEELAVVRAQLQGVADQYNGAIATIQQQSAQLQLDRSAYGDQIQKLQGANAELQREREDFLKANRSLKEELASLEALLQGQAVDDDASRAIKEAYDRVAIENDRFFEEAEQLQQQAQQVGVQVNVSVQAFDGLAAALDRLEAQNAELKALIEMLQAQLAASTQDILDEIKRKTNELRIEDMDQLNSLIVSTNPTKFASQLRKAVLNNDVVAAVPLIRYGVELSTTNRKVDEELIGRGVDLPSAMVAMLADWDFSAPGGNKLLNESARKYAAQKKSLDAAYKMLDAVSSVGATTDTPFFSGSSDFPVQIPTYGRGGALHKEWSPEALVYAYEKGVITDNHSIPFRDGWQVKNGVTYQNGTFLSMLFFSVLFATGSHEPEQMDKMEDFMKTPKTPTQCYTPERVIHCIYALLKAGARDDDIPKIMKVLVDMKVPKVDIGLRSTAEEINRQAASDARYFPDEVERHKRGRQFIAAMKAFYERFT